MVPYPLRIIGTVAATALFGYFIESFDQFTFTVAAIVTSPILPFLWMSVQVLEINDDAHYWWVYYWVLGYKIGKKNPYGQIESLKLTAKTLERKKGKEELRYYGEIHFDNHQSTTLTSRKSISFMREKMSYFSEKVDAPFIDETQENDE
jgi:hypothetical protein